MSGYVPAPDEKDLYKIVRAVRSLYEGRTNAVGAVTLTVNAASTTVSAINCGLGNRVFLMPMTANAAAALATTYIQAANVTGGQFVITHANNAQNDRTFGYVVLG